MPSPTTTSAVKLKRRPPLTTLATRLIATTRSMYDWPLSAPPRRSSRRSRRSPPPRRGAAISGSSSRQRLPANGPSERQPALARAVGQRRDATVVPVPRAVKHDGGDPGLLGALGQQLADLARLGGLV